MDVFYWTIEFSYACSQLGMKRKKKWAVEGQIKRTNWKAVPASKLTEKVGDLTQDKFI